MPTTIHTDAEREAKRIDADKRRIEAALLFFGGESASGKLLPIISNVKTHAVSAYRLNQNPGHAAQQTLAGNGRVSGLGPVLARHMLAANIQARTRTVKRAEKETDVEGRILAALLLLSDADETRLLAEYERAAQPLVDRLASRVAAAVKSGVHNARIDEYKPGVAKVTAEQAIADALAKTGVARPTKGNPVAGWSIQRMAEFLVGMGYVDGTNTVLNHPAIKALDPEGAYVTMHDDRVRPLHRTFDGEIRKLSEWYAEGITPPVWDYQGVPQYGCRCTLVPLFS